MRRYFALWLLFTLTIYLLLAGSTLQSHYQAVKLEQRAAWEGFVALVLRDFRDHAENFSTLGVPQWSWGQLWSAWQRQYSEISGVALVDTVDGNVVHSYGQFPSEWSPVLNDPGDEATHFLHDSRANQYWTIIPSPTLEPRYRLWVSLGPELDFLSFLHNRRNFFLVQAGVCLVLFMLFYLKWGNPRRYLIYFTRTIQRSLDHGDQPINLPTSTLPGEFHPLARTLTLLLERRQRDAETIMNLESQIQQVVRQREHHSLQVRSLESKREQDLVLARKLVTTLLDTSQDPLLILTPDWIVSFMNEAARRVLDLSGQTGSELRHVELEKMLEGFGQQTFGQNEPLRLVTRDPYLQRTLEWRVKIAMVPYDEPANNPYRLIVSLHLAEDRLETRSSLSQWGHYLMPALEETHKTKSPPPSSICPTELQFLIQLIGVLNKRHGRTSLQHLWQRLSDQPMSNLEGEVECFGDVVLWDRFFDWLLFMVERLVGSSTPTAIEFHSPNRLVAEWESPKPIPFDQYVSSTAGACCRLRAELFNDCSRVLKMRLMRSAQRPGWLGMELIGSANPTPGSAMATRTTVLRPGRIAGPGA